MCFIASPPSSCRPQPLALGARHGAVPNGDPGARLQPDEPGRRRTVAMLLVLPVFVARQADDRVRWMRLEELLPILRGLVPGDAEQERDADLRMLERQRDDQVREVEWRISDDPIDHRPRTHPWAWLRRILTVDRRPRRVVERPVVLLIRFVDDDRAAAIRSLLDEHARDGSPAGARLEDVPANRHPGHQRARLERRRLVEVVVLATFRLALGADVEEVLRWHYAASHRNFPCVGCLSTLGREPRDHVPPPASPINR